MIVLGHISYPSLAFIIFAKILGIEYSMPHLLLLMLFSILPDMDFFFHALVRKGKYDSSFQHRKWFTHWPISYSPLLVLLYFYPSMALFVACLGIYSHLALDTLFCDDGIMVFYPFSKKFYNFFGSKFRNTHGVEWLRVYKKQMIFKLDVVSFISLLIILLMRI